MRSLMYGLTMMAALVIGIPADAQQFWMSGIPVNWMNRQLHQPPNDFMDAFQPGAPWQQGLAGIAVFKIPAQLVLFGSDDQVRAVFGEMQRRHMRMAVEIGSVVRQEACGGGEGYAGGDLAERVGRRVKDLGGVLDYMALDEPVWFAAEKTWGTAAQGAPNCAYGLARVAALAGLSIAGMRKSFSAIEIGDIEPITPDRISPQRLIADYVAFARLIEQQTGRKMAFFHADIATGSKGPWLPMMAMLKRQMHAIGVPVGAIIGGGLRDRPDAVWTQAGLDLLSEISRSPDTSLDQVIIQSWQVYPTHMLPESQAGTSTFLLLQSERMLQR